MAENENTTGTSLDALGEACEALRGALQKAADFPAVAEGGSVAIHSADGKTIATRGDNGEVSGTFIGNGLRITTKDANCPTEVSSR